MLLIHGGPCIIGAFTLARHYKKRWRIDKPCENRYMMNPRQAFGLVTANGADFLLKSVSASVSLGDMYAHVKLTQRYSNNFRGSEPVSVRHIFPIPAHATVCGLEMRPSKEKVLKAVAKDSKEAETDFQTAFAKGKWASVLNEVTSDVFVTLISAVPENDEVEITVNYVTPLLEDELPHQLRFTLPAFVGQRYGSPPPSIDARSSTGHNVLFSVEVDVQMTSTIQNISSSSHLIQTTSVTPTHQIVVLHPNTLPVFLDNEFVLSVQTDKLDEPLCIAEVDVANNTVAMALALVPRFDPDLVSKQEYIFLIDRSDSMQANERMGSAKRAADFLLKHLPSEGTLFNVISFGASFSSLWQSSRPYNEWNTYLATSHVNLMNADMGGIDLGGVLRHVFRTRKRPVSTAIFVLTSGDIWNSDAVISSVRSHISAADAASSGGVRIFTLGIGQNASSALCEDLARAGHGLCIMTTETEALTGKCGKLLAAAKASPSMRTIQYEWENAVFPTCSPLDVSDVYPDNRVLVYTVLPQTTQVPNFVTLRLTLPSERTVEFRAPVTTMQTPREVKLPIHTLAAKSVLRELEDSYPGNKKQKASTSSSPSEKAGQAMIINLSKDHQLISKLTSFITVDD
ncbi:hypothetical protein SISNIDRAFT_427368, partial [Sistotremastrum niveocremeum HHB9708]